MLHTGTVTKSTGSWYLVRYGDQTCRCKITGKFRIKGIKTTNPVTVGDIVDIEVNESQDFGWIKNIHERKNYIIRKSTNLSRQAHIIAANIDQAILIATIDYPETTTIFIDRFLVTAEAYNIPATLIFNKTDLYTTEQISYLDDLIHTYQNIGYCSFKTSVKENFNMDVFRDLLQGNTSLISGHSGVGKSSMINLIDPELDLKTANISDYHRKGKHTTTFYEMFELSIGGKIIDTPGIKGFGVIDMKGENISHYFPEMFRLTEQCKFYNCTHVHEPGCAVKEAVEKGKIAESRYKSYLNIHFDEDTKYR
jgi:ribosome biogenesis GTPase / thiamine phosphate phosphatase